MKKYLILLTIPLLFFSIGCNDDDDNGYSIPVSEYPESILGHWRYDSREQTTITQNIEVDPVYGTETVTTEQEDDFTSYNPAQGIYFQWEVILNIFIFNGEKSSIFPLGRNPQYFQWEEILNNFECEEILNNFECEETL